MSDGSKIEWDWPRVAAGLVGLAIALIFFIKMLFGFRSDGRLTDCQANLESVVRASKKYADKNKGQYPPDLAELVSSHLLQELPTCPVANQMTFTDYTMSKRPLAMTVSCCGGHHRKQFRGEGDPLKFPTYSSWVVVPAKK